MGEANSYFFCGIGGSGMLPLACIVKARGFAVAGSDRTLDQGRLGPKFEYLKSAGIDLFPQDGSGLSSRPQILVTSAAVEETVPDVVRARELGLERITRPQLLAQLFNDAGIGIAVGGTSGKSTTTGMIGWILDALGREPTVMNGAVMKNFVTPETPFASALAGGGDAFVSEVDESDGSIALYQPDVAVLGNITLDHKSLDELRGLFFDFVSKAGTAILNLDDEETRLLSDRVSRDKLVTFSFRNTAADIIGANVVEEPLAISFLATDRRTGEHAEVRLQVPGRHNAQNALAAIAAAQVAGVSLEEAAQALSGFSGLRRRFEVIGTAGNVSVIDDFGHNPDKITATLRTLHAFPGRLLIFFQPHGFGPLKAMKDELIACFVEQMQGEDHLVLCDPVYHGGTVDRSVGSGDIVDGVSAGGRNAEYIASRAECGERLVALARPGDRIIVMGARDDSLSIFAEEVLLGLRIPQEAS